MSEPDAGRSDDGTVGTTTRQRIAAHLRSEAAPPSELAVEFEISPKTALKHVRHLARSMRHDDAELLVAPPECRDCGFNRFDDRANLPSRCPECKSEAIDEPVFKVAD